MSRRYRRRTSGCLLTKQVTKLRSGTQEVLLYKWPFHDWKSTERVPCHARSCKAVLRNQMLGMKGKCLCTPSWRSGDDCSKPQCPVGTNNQVCSGRGQLKFDGSLCKCVCASGWKGAACDFSKCAGGSKQNSVLCSGHGKPVLDKGNSGDCKCKCEDGWTGERCDEPICPMSREPTVAADTCETKKEAKKEKPSRVCGGPERGTPTVKNGVCTCACKLPYRGKACEITSCPIAADNKLACGGTTQGLSKLSSAGCACTCESGWAGKACDVALCPGRSKPCSCHGTPVFDPQTACKCKCQDGWKGKNCDDPVCPVVDGKLCAGRGDCVEGKCKCKLSLAIDGHFEQAWGGVDCKTPICPKFRVESEWLVCGGPRYGKPFLRPDGSCTCQCRAGNSLPFCVNTPAPAQTIAPTPRVCQQCKVGR